MATETEKILIEVEIDNEEARKNEIELIALIEKERQELGLRRKELKKSGGDNKEAAKRIGELSRSLKSNNTQLRNNQKQLQANDNSINGLRASVSKLTAERNNLDTSSKKGRTEFEKLTKEIKEQNERLNNLGKDVGDFRGNVANYTESMKDAIEQTDIFGGSLGGILGGLGGVGKVIKNIIPTLGTLKGALIALPIFAVVAALTALIAFFTKTKKGAQLLERAMGAISAVTNLLIDNVAEFGELIVDAFSNPKQALKDLGDAIVTNVLNRFKSLSLFVEAIALAFSGEWTAAMKKGGDAIIQLTTGVEDGTDKIAKFGEEIEKSAIIGFNAVAQNQRLTASIRALTVAAKEGELQAEANRKLRDDETKSLEERLEFNRLAGEGELKRLDAEKRIAKARLQILVNRRQLERDFSDETLQEEADLKGEIITIQADFEGRSTEILTNANALRKEAREKEADALKESEEKDVQERQEFLDTREQQITAALEKRKKSEEDTTAFQQREADKRKKINDEEVANRIATLQAIGSAVSVAQGLFEENTTAFKILAVTRATIDTFLGANNALGSLPIPANFIAAAAIITTGLINVGQILNAQSGVIGLSGGGTSTSDSVPARLSRGESVMTARATQMFGKQLIAMEQMASGSVNIGSVGNSIGGTLQANSIASDVGQRSDLARNITESIMNQPAPILDFKEFTRFQNRVDFKESRADV